MWLLVSATITLPEVSTATPEGPEKSAAVPTPLVEPVVLPDELPPASVMTVCAGVRINVRNMKTTTSFEDIVRVCEKGGGGVC